MFLVPEVQTTARFPWREWSWLLLRIPLYFCGEKSFVCMYYICWGCRLTSFRYIWWCLFSLDLFFYIILITCCYGPSPYFAIFLAILTFSSSTTHVLSLLHFILSTVSQHTFNFFPNLWLLITLSLHHFIPALSMLCINASIFQMLMFALFLMPLCFVFMCHVTKIGLLHLHHLLLTNIDDELMVHRLFRDSGC